MWPLSSGANNTAPHVQFLGRFLEAETGLTETFVRGCLSGMCAVVCLAVSQAFFGGLLIGLRGNKTKNMRFFVQAKTKTTQESSLA